MNKTVGYLAGIVALTFAMLGALYLYEAQPEPMPDPGLEAPTTRAPAQPTDRVSDNRSRPEHVRDAASVSPEIASDLPESAVQNIGADLDPDDPAFGFSAVTDEVQNIGADINPGERDTFVQDDEPREVFNIGDDIDPDDPTYQPRSAHADTVANTGRDIDPDDYHSVADHSEGGLPRNTGPDIDPDQE